MTKKIAVAVFAALAFAGSVAQADAAGSNGAGLGFDMTGSFYMPADSRFSGVGSGVNITIKVDDNLTMGYRVEELSVRGEETVAGVKTTGNNSVMFQGINAFYRTATFDKVSVDLGLWMGSAVTDVLGSAAVGDAQQSVLLEPQGRIVYATTGKVDSRVTVGLGYRFVPGFNATGPNVLSAASTKELKNFNGLTLSLGVGLGF
ncbi:MAG: hypothetical protein WCW52_07605 [Elusimicrobiales bacterium]|jgi:hypothetical protein